jgi:hypothetical protein
MAMSQGVLTVQPDRSLVVEKVLVDDAVSLKAKLLAFAEQASDTETQIIYRITDESIWKARRSGLSCENILQTLETYSQNAIPANVLADIETWSKKIERLALVTKQGRLVLRGSNPLVITAVLRHSKLAEFVKQPIDATTLELKAEKYPEVVRIFDYYKYPVLDHVTRGRSTTRPKRGAAKSRRRKATKQPARQEQKALPPITTPLEEVPQDQSRPEETPQAVSNPLRILEMLRMYLPHQCQATTKAGYQCKNKAQPNSPFCWVHAERATGTETIDESALNRQIARKLLDLMVDVGLITREQITLIQVGIWVGVSLSTWLLYHLFMWIGASWLYLPFASWYTPVIAFLLSTWLLGRMLARIDFLTSLQILFTTLLSLLLDFFHKEGLILNICFLLIPVVLPAYLLYRYALSLWWDSSSFQPDLALASCFTSCSKRHPQGMIIGYNPSMSVPDATALPLETADNRAQPGQGLLLHLVSDARCTRAWQR